MYYKYRYDMIGANLDCHVNKHPQQDMKDRGYQFVCSAAFPLGEFWYFFTEYELADTPSYLTFFKSADTLEKLLNMSNS